MTAECRGFAGVGSAVSFVPSMRSLLLAAVLATLPAPVLAQAGPAIGEHTADDPAQVQKRVLVIYGGNRETQAGIVGDRELPRMLGHGLTGVLDYYSEYIDRTRYVEGDYQSAFRDFLQLKYEGQRFDLVIAMDYIALDFLDRHRDGLFPRVPLVFFTSRALPRRPANSAGVAVPLKLGDSLQFALELQPDLRHVFVVNGTDPAYDARAREEFQAFEPRLTIAYLSGLATKTLETRLSALPEHSMVFYMHVGRDGAGANYNPLDYLNKIAAIASAPTYSWVDSAMDRGIVGGSLRSLVGQSQAVADLSLRVLNGERADDLPIESPNLQIREVDWRQLRRWNIDPERIPAGTVIRFRERSLWDRFKYYMFGAGVIVVGQSALIAGMLVTRARRRRAEARARSSEQALRRSYERIRDLGRRLLHAQETERAHIARELHDDISQQLALLEIDLELFGRSPSGPGSQALDEILARAHGVGRSVHDLSHRLHPTKLRLIGLIGALQGLKAEMAHPGLIVTFTHEHVPPGLPPDLTLCLFRVAQEGLQNAAKYSRASNVTVTLTGEPGVLKMSIADNGVGFDVQAVLGQGLGLVSMAERLDAQGGQFEIESLPGAGTQIRVTVPVPEAAGRHSIAV